MKSAQQMAQNWGNAMSNPQTATKYKQGIAATTVNPMQLAAAAQQLYLNNVTQAVQSGRYAAKLNAVPQALWSNNAQQFGAANLANGAKKGQPKVDAFFQRWAPIFQQSSAAARAIQKDGTLATAMQKVQANLQVLMGAKGT